MLELEPVIGIEIHVELKTKTKLFSATPVSFGAKPNSQVNEIDLGYPGTLPTINEQALVLAIRACHALKMAISPTLVFDRKNYFYSDLPKGYQITQQDHPIGRNGQLLVTTANDKQQTIAINRLHIEEDTAKQIHLPTQSWLDYNRAGNGLLEIVSEPVIHNVQTAVSYIETLRKLLVSLAVTDGKMSEGSLRCDINISMRPVNSKTLAKRVEVKNLNSLQNVKRAINFEIERQTKLIVANKPMLYDETRRFDEKTKTTILMRSKETAMDYKYFREPNIVPLVIASDWVAEIIAQMPETYVMKQKRYRDTFLLNDAEITILFQHEKLCDFFEITAKKVQNYRLLWLILTGNVVSYLKQKNVTLAATKLTTLKLAQLVNLLDAKKIDHSQSKMLLKQLFETDFEVKALLAKQNRDQISDVQQIRIWLQPLLIANMALLKEYETRPERVLKFFMGQLMKVTKGQVVPEVGLKVIKELITENLNNLKN